MSFRDYLPENGWKDVKSAFILLVQCVVVLFAVTAPFFHFVPSEGIMFPKKHISLEYTLITQSDVEDLVRRYNHANLFERLSLQNEDIYRALSDRGLLVSREEIDTSVHPLNMEEQDSVIRSKY